VILLSANHVDPDLGAEIFVLDAPADHRELPATPTDGAPAPASNQHQCSISVIAASSSTLLR
jgi:hypothetical protein